MGLAFYNTLNHRIEEFKEIEKGQVKMYTCGPTVYDLPHIGNYRTFVFEDLVKRYLLYSGYRVFHVMNITDIEDKIIRKANELKLTMAQVTASSIQAFFQDCETLNLSKADVYPRATEHIPEMAELIEKLIQAGYAYRRDDSIYFNIGRFSPYGRLANIDKESLKTGVRIDVDEYEKENVQDFVLWKGRKPGEPSWNTAIGEGRPGWHIECSAMSMKYLGTHFDIHMGGVDNIFPHHENEIAQSQGATGSRFVNYWLHCQHLVVDNQKMSKSLGNFFTLRDILERGHDPMAIRYLLLSSHYRKMLNFSFENLEMAKQSLNRIQDFIFGLKDLKAPVGESPDIGRLISTSRLAFNQSLDDDFNISAGLGVLFDLIYQINLKKEQLRQGDAAQTLDFIRQINAVLGIIGEQPQVISDHEILEKIEEREKARKKKNYQLADAIRQELKEKGIHLLDTPDGVKWKIDKSL